MNPDNLIKSIQLSLLKLEEGNLDTDQQIKDLDQIIRQVIAILSEKENLYFSSYYAKFSFLATKYKISGKDQFLFHRFRIIAKNKNELKKEHLTLGHYVLNSISKKLLNTELAQNVSTDDVAHFFTYPKREDNEQFIPYLQVYLHELDAEQNAFIIQNEEGQKWRMSMAESDDNEQLTDQYNLLKKWNRLPIKLALFDTKSKEKKEV